MSKFKVGDLVEIVDDSCMFWNFKGERVVLEESSFDSFDFNVTFDNWLVQWVDISEIKMAMPFKVGDKVVCKYGREESIHSILSEDKFVAINSDWDFSVECFSEFKLIKEELKVGDIIIDEFMGKGEILQFLGKDDMWDNNLLVKDSDWDFSIIDGDNLK